MYFPASKSPASTPPSGPQTFPQQVQNALQHIITGQKKERKVKTKRGAERRREEIWSGATINSGTALHDNMELSQLCRWHTARDRLPPSISSTRVTSHSFCQRSRVTRPLIHSVPPLGNGGETIQPLCNTGQNWNKSKGIAKMWGYQGRGLERWTQHEWGSSKSSGIMRQLMKTKTTV